MKSLSQTDIIRSMRNDIKNLGDDELRQAFTECLLASGERLTRCGVALVELESRGIQVEAAPRLIELLRAIGEGSLIAEVVVRFASEPMTLRRVTKLTVIEQQKVLSGDLSVIRKRSCRDRSSSRRETMVEIGRRMRPAELGKMIVNMIQANDIPSEVWRVICTDLSIRNLASHCHIGAGRLA